MAVKRPAASRTSDDTVRVRRSYFDCRFGQLHVRTGFPTTGGFDERTTLVCFHPSPLSSRAFARFLPHMARERSVYAPDLPGCGESDAPAGKPGIAEYSAAMGDFLTQMRFREVDVLGYHGGALVATELAIQRPEHVRRLVLVGLPISTPQERDAFARQGNPAPGEDGTHLAREWQRALEARGPGVTLETVSESFAEKLRNGAGAWLATNAAHQYPAAERLPLLRQPVLALRPRDHTWESSAQARQLIRGVKVVDLTEHGSGVFDVAPDVIAQHVRVFLDA